MKKELVENLKRQYIVNNTKALIEKEGINNINMEAIAKASGYTKRTLYAYFTSKDEILLWAFTDDITARWHFQKERLAFKNTGIEKLKEWAESLYEYCNFNTLSIQFQTYMDYYFVDPDKIRESIFRKFESINNELANGLRQIFNQAHNSGEISKNLNIDIAISQFLYSYRAILNRAFSDQYSFTDIDKDAYVNYFIDSYISGLIHVNQSI